MNILVDAANSAGGHYAHARIMRKPDGGRHRGCTAASARQHDRQIPQAHFVDILVLAEPQDVFFRAVRIHFSIQNADGAGLGTVRANDALQFDCQVPVGRVGEPVGKHRGFKSHVGRRRIGK